MFDEMAGNQTVFFLMPEGMRFRSFRIAEGWKEIFIDSHTKTDPLFCSMTVHRMGYPLYGNWEMIVLDFL